MSDMILDEENIRWNTGMIVHSKIRAKWSIRDCEPGYGGSEGENGLHCRRLSGSRTR